MAGKFTNITYANTIDNLVAASNSKINNPYYKFSDQKPTKVTYYNQNIEKSTLDEASGLYMEHIGTNSPFKFNKIKEFYLYGIERISTEYDLGDNGIEAGSISGDCIVLPNTINPRPGDFFYISYVKEDILFKVNSVSVDTLDTGANIYKIEYGLEKTNTIESIEEQVDKSYTFLINNIGTDFKAIIRDDDYNLIDKLQTLVSEMITVFNNIFFKTKLQTFIFSHDSWLMYDPYMVEFLIRNKVFDYGDNYVYVGHACYTGETFAMDYMKSFFYSLENRDIENINSGIATADKINDINSLFNARIELYYQVRYVDNTPYKTRFFTIDQDVISHIKSNEKYPTGDANEVYNLWISYFNNEKDYINGDILSIVKTMDAMDNLHYFYAIPITIFIIEKYIESLLS